MHNFFFFFFGTGLCLVRLENGQKSEKKAVALIHMYYKELWVLFLVGFGASKALLKS